MHSNSHASRTISLSNTNINNAVDVGHGWTSVSLTPKSLQGSVMGTHVGSGSMSCHNMNTNHWTITSQEHKHDRKHQRCRKPLVLIPTMLLIEGPKFSGFDFTPGASTGYEAHGEPFYINNRRILLASKQDPLEPRDRELDLEDEPLSHTSKTAKSVWDCSIIMSKYLEALSLKQAGFWSDKRLIELGAGQGLSSFSAAALGAEVIITDVDTAIPSLQRGAQLNGLSEPQVRVQALDWMNHTQEIQEASKKPLDYIIASDVIWVDFLIAPLVNTIAQLMQVSKERRDSLLDEDNIRSEELTPPVLILAHQSRSARCDNMFFDSLDALGLQRKKIRLDGHDTDEDSVDLDPKYRKSNLAIWKVWRE